MPKNKEHRLRNGLSANMAITVGCEWGPCTEEFTTMDTYSTHVTLHLERVLLSEEKQAGENGEEAYHCEWKGCIQDMERGFIDLVRHVYFHAFHAKLKSLGRTIIDKNELDECGLEASSRNMIPELPDRLQCGWTGCTVISDNPDYFYQHVTSHIHVYNSGNTLPELAACLWEGCETKTKNKYKLREHLRSHTQEKVIACPTCGGLFANATKLFDHLQRQIQPRVQTYQCSHCNKRCPTERLLRDHMRHHVNHYKCPFCDMTCPNPSGLRAHIKYRHSNDKPYVCTECDYRGKSLADLRRHSAIHPSDAAPFSCNMDDCQYTGKSFFALTVHFKKEHQGVVSSRYHCHLCTQSFTRGTSLTNHLKKSHKFKWPSGHRRFRYKLNDDGQYRLQTVRFESIELTQQLLSDKIGDDGGPPTDSQTHNDLAEGDGQEDDEDLLGDESGVEPEGDDDSEGTETGAATTTPAAAAAESDLCYNLEMLGEVAMKLPKGRFCRQAEQRKRKREDAESEDGVSVMGTDGASVIAGDIADQSDVGDMSDAYEESVCGRSSSVRYSESECSQSRYDPSELDYQASSCYMGSDPFTGGSDSAITASLQYNDLSLAHPTESYMQLNNHTNIQPDQDLPPMYGPAAHSVDADVSPQKSGHDPRPRTQHHIHQLPTNIEATTQLFGGLNS